MGEDLGHLFSLHFVECYMSARFLSDPCAHGGSLTNKKCSLQIFWKNCGDFGEMQEGGVWSTDFFKTSQKSIGLVIPIY